MDNNQNDDGLGKYKKDFEEIQDYCMILKKIEENTELIYKNLNDNNTQTKSEMAYLIDIKDYNKFKQAIVNSIQDLYKLLRENHEYIPSSFLSIKFWINSALIIIYS